MKSKKTLLIAIDSATRIDGLIHLLNSNGYTVFHGNDGNQAFKLIEENEPDLVITDISISGMNGYELCRAIKNNIAIKHIPVIILTSQDKITTVLEGLEAGADDFIPKPINENFFLYRLNQIFDNRKKPTIKNKDNKLQFNINNEIFTLDSDPQKILHFFVSTYETVIHTYKALQKLQDEFKVLNESLEEIVNERTEKLLNEVNEYKRTSTNLQKKEFILSKAQAIARLGSWEMNILTGEVEWSEELYKILEYDPAHTRPCLESLINALHPNDRLLTAKALESAIRTAKDFEIEKRILLADRDLRHILIHGEVETQDGQAVKMTGYIQDITERKTSEMDLQIALQKAEETDKLKTAFLHNLSHEIRTPMNAVMGFSTLMCDQNTTQEEHKVYSEHIASSAKSLLEVIDDIIDAAMIETGQVELKPSTCLLNNLMMNIYDEASKTFVNAKSNIHFNFDAHSEYDTLQIETFPDKLKLIFRKLLSNAFKFTEKGTIKFGYDLEGNESVIFYVSDTGIGIPENKRGEIFKKFTKLSANYKIKHAGMGVGLSTTNKLVTIMNGKMWVDSIPGVGSTFYFKIPVTIITGSKSDVKKSPSTTSSLLNNIKILLAEDVETNYVLVERILSKAGAKILWVKNGKEAVEEFRKNPETDLVLMDIQMPIMDGYEATSKIREINLNVPIIALTAFALEHEKDEMLAKGFDDLITKPLEPAYLTKTIEKTLMNLV